jgi:ABC-type sulfate transport system substrate-binding protein
VKNNSNTQNNNKRLIRLTGWVAAFLVIATLAYYGGRVIVAGATHPSRLVVYAFSTQEEVLTQGIFPAFKQLWEKDTGQELTIEAVFGPSGTLAGQINLGAPADVAIFSNARHVKWLTFGRLVHQDTVPIVIGSTPIVIITRLGNPLRIMKYEDLAKPGTRLIHADPRTSGVGEWALLAEYGSALLSSGDQIDAEFQFKEIWENVRLMAPSARATLMMFELGAGDALVTYEQDALLALDRGVALDIVAPDYTIITQPVAVTVDENVTKVEQPLVDAFITFLLSDTGQKILAQYHLHPANFDYSSIQAFTGYFTADDLGGWSKIYAETVEPYWQTEIKPFLDLEPAYRDLEIGE